MFPYAINIIQITKLGQRFEIYTKDDYITSGKTFELMGDPMKRHLIDGLKVTKINIMGRTLQLTCYKEETDE